MSVASEFWRNKTVIDHERLSDIWKWDKKLSYDIQKLIPHVRQSKFIADLGCGNGKKIKLLDEIINFDEVFVSDISQHILFDTLITSSEHFFGEVSDFKNHIPNVVRECDTVMSLSTLNYLNGDEIEEFIKFVFPTKLIISIACSEESKYVCEHSKELDERFESNYPTVKWVEDLLMKYYDTVTKERMYPNDLEGEYGNRTYLFVAKVI